MGGFDDRSLEIDIDFSTLPPPTSEMSPDTALRELWPDPVTQSLPLDLAVFDPMGFGLADSLREYGFPLRELASGVDVMTGVAVHPTAAVICGPAEDAEQRRLLTAAIRLRFPQIPVIYVSTHGTNPQAVRGALAEGAHAVLPLPFPSEAHVVHALQPYISPRRVPTPVTLGATPKESSRVAVSRDEFAIPPPVTGQDAIDDHLSFESNLPTEVVISSMPALKLQPASEPSTSPIRAVPRTDGSVEMKKGELGELLRAISPFLWGLDDAARWTDAHADAGDPTAAGHARTLKLLAKILRQLQDRVDERGL